MAPPDGGHRGAPERSVFLRPKRFGAGFSRQRQVLALFSPTAVLCLRPGPAPAASIRTAVTGNWTPCRGDDSRFNFKDAIVQNEGFRQERARALASCRLVFDRDLSTNLAMDAFLDCVEPCHKDQLRRLRHHSWAVYAALCRAPGMDELLHNNVGLAVALSNHASMAKRAVQWPMRSIRRLLKSHKRRDIAAALGWPDRRASVRVLARIDPEAACLPHLLTLRELAHDPRWSRRLSHLPRINKGVAQLLGDPVTRERCKMSFLLELADYEDFPIAGAIAHMLGQFAAANRSAPQLHSLQQAIDLLHEGQALEWAGRLRLGQYGQPPVGGTEDIVPLLNSDELDREALVQRNCLSSSDYYEYRISEGGLWVYRVMAPERCTLSIKRQSAEEQWTISELSTRYNGDPAMTTRRAVERWLKKHNDSPPPTPCVEPSDIDPRQLTLALDMCGLGRPDADATGDDEMGEFVHLRGMTRYSAGNGALDIGRLVDAAVAMGAPAVAISDQHSVCGAVELSRHARRAGLKAIIACELVVQERPLGSPSPGSVGTLLLVARTRAGLAHLSRLSSLAWTSGWTGSEPRLDLATLAEHADGLMVIVGGLNSVTGQRLAGRRAGRLTGRINQLLEVFDREHIFLEVQRDDEENLDAIAATVALAQRTGLRPVATADCRGGVEDGEDDGGFGTPTVDPRTGRERLLEIPPTQHFIAPEVMAERFATLPSALANTLHLAALVEADACPLPQPTVWPRPPMPEGMNAERHLGNLATSGLCELLESERLDDDIDPRRYWQRLMAELRQIEAAGCAAAYLVYSDLARYARDHNIMIGPGRDQTGSSLVCRAIGLTTLDPLANGLFFERQLQPCGTRPPQLSIEVPHDRRQELLDHLALRYGRERLVYLSPHVGEPSLPINEPSQFNCLDEPGPSRTRPRPSGGEAGVAICPGPAVNWLPLMRDEAGEVISQYGAAEINESGIWAVVLGSSHCLARMGAAVDAVNERRGWAPFLRMEDINPHNPAIYAADQTSTDDNEASMQGQLCQQIAPPLQADCFDDLVARSALKQLPLLDSAASDAYRDRKRGNSVAKPHHPAVADLLASTQGLVLYEEQVIAIIARQTGCSPAEAEMDRQLMKLDALSGEEFGSLAFVERAAANGNLRFGLSALFDEVRRAAGEASSKPHALHVARLQAYELWLQRYHPLEYTWATLRDTHDRVRVADAVVKAQSRGVDVRGPDVNLSDFEDRIECGYVRLGLRRLRGLAPGVAAAIAHERVTGSFDSIDNLASRLAAEHATAQTLDVLACAGALDGFVVDERPLAEQRLGAVKRARACASERLGLRMTPLAGAGWWDVERVVTEEQRAMGGVTVSGFGLLSGVWVVLLCLGFGL